ncbi:MAG: hypothetical protein ISS70_09550 [Phycisphaerae bacterium]|nr:hypothetical protein [Phycisphaerae bacterium]
MPSGTRVTFVRTGSLRIKMKAEFDVEPYDLELTADQAVVTAPGTLLQLINDTLESCHVLYIVSPAYLVLLNDDHVVYDDSIILGEDWDNVTCVRWNSQELQIARHEAYIELAAKKVRKS